ncbi:4-hydroxyphenylpyruvate dioxygenase [Streptomyces hainanensis]|uniref:4-hydroxyphenylpyruvate dioxygenase n=1 Tax=Streptomyces hainanensis TaxID=402648 RepID=UPI001FB7E3E3|nr:4-hydroxyphenylpyruvate dioxygenase [Streptomyces hainanensis]
MSVETSLEYVELYVTDAEASAGDFVREYGFEVAGRLAPDAATHRSVAVRQGRILLVLTQGLADEHPASEYVQEHGDGVAVVALRTDDAAAAYAAAVDAGASPVAAPHRPEGPAGPAVAEVAGFGGVRLAFVQHPGAPGGPAEPTARRVPLPPGLVPCDQEPPGTAQPVRLGAVDHFAVCVPAGELAATVAFYEVALGFRMIFEERIVVGNQSMNSQVVQNARGDVTFTLIEPDTTREAGQIDEFLKNHGGAGVQHVAFSADDIVRAVGMLRANGVEFLETPRAYYTLLPERMDLDRHGVDALMRLNILADADHSGQLYQIFTRSRHPRRTLFMEIIERFGAETFGSGNIKALYEAVELDSTAPGGARSAK